MVERPLRSVIIGTGFMGATHARAVRAAGGVVAGVVGSRPEKAEQVLAAFGADRAFDTVDQALSTDDVDLVHICTPNATHLELATATMAAGKHVICEKPIATSLADAHQLVDAAATAQVVNAVPFVYRFHATAREAKARIARGDAGDIRLIHGSYLQDWLSRSTETNWRVDPAKGGASRAFGDIGVHWCDLVEFVSGHRIARLSSQLLTVPRAGVGGTEDGATVVFDTDRGAVGSVVISQVSPGRKNRLWFSIDGAEASYEFNQETPDTLWIGGRDQSVILPRAAEAAIAAARFDLVPTGHPQGYPDAFTLFVMDTHRAIRGDNPTELGLPQFTDGLRAARITQAVLDSAASGGWVDVPA